MILYLNQHLGTLEIRPTLVDIKNKTNIPCETFQAKNYEEFISRVASLIAQHNDVQEVATNLIMYANSTTEEDLNKALSLTYKKNTKIRMVYKKL